MFEIVFLGTSASAPSIHRGLPAQAILAGEYRFLIDCGEGTQRQILAAALASRSCIVFYLTHAHLDHILGLGSIDLCPLGKYFRIGNLGWKVTLDWVRALLFGVVLDYERIAITIHLKEIRTGQVILDTKDFAVSAFPVTHGAVEISGSYFRKTPSTIFERKS